jgi:hypothetical protein
MDSTTISKTDNFLKTKVFNGGAVYYFLLILLIAKILFLKYIPTSILSIYQSLVFRGVIALLVAVVAWYDYILATLIIVCYVLAIKELNNRNSSSVVGNGNLNFLNSVKNELSNIKFIIPSSPDLPSKDTITNILTPVPTGALATPNIQTNSVSYFSMPTTTPPMTTTAPTISASTNVNMPLTGVDFTNVNYTLKNVNAVNLINQINSEVGQSNSVLATNTLVDMISASHPSTKTLSENLMSKGFENLNLEQLNLSTSNLITGVSPDVAVASNPIQLNAQGLNMPSGYDTEMTKTSKF